MFRGESVALTLEQQLKHEAFCRQVDKMSLEQAHGLLVVMYKQSVISDTVYNALLRKQWGVGK